MFSKITLFAAIAVVAYCVPVEVSPVTNPVSSPVTSQVTKEPVPIVSQENQVGPEGNYKWSFESGDGTKQEQVGAVKAVDQKNVTETVQGSVEYKDNEGKPHTLTYIADENGYQPTGDDIPVPPPIPADILRALEFIAAHPEQNVESEKIH